MDTLTAEASFYISTIRLLVLSTPQHITYGVCMVERTTRDDQCSSGRLFSIITSLTIPDKEISLGSSITLHNRYSYVFSAPMLAFKEPEEPRQHHPAPLMALKSGYSFECHLEVEFSKTEEEYGLQELDTLWLFTAILRLKFNVPIRALTLSSKPLPELLEDPKTFSASIHEVHARQIRLVGDRSKELDLLDIGWILLNFPKMVKLVENERFNRAVTIFEQAQWSDTAHGAATLVWSSLETLFDIGPQRDKTKALCQALSDYVTIDRSDRDKAYGVIQNLAKQRGRFIHAGHPIKNDDAAQILRFGQLALIIAIQREEVPAPFSDR